MRTFNIYPRGGTRIGSTRASMADAVNNYHNSINARALRVVQPTISPDGGSFVGFAVVTISTPTYGADIYYTTNGQDPDFNSTPYTSTIAISSSSTLKAIAYLPGAVTSTIATANFIIA